jgi:hypothetical protein
MILLFPTNDSLFLTSEIEKANSFRYISIVNGYINKDEIRKTDIFSVDNLLSSIEKEYKETGNRRAVITNAISKEVEDIVRKHHFEVIITKENNIVNALIGYIKNIAVSESDYCCCP